jgi:hypothetical protein
MRLLELSTFKILPSAIRIASILVTEELIRIFPPAPLAFLRAIKIKILSNPGYVILVSICIFSPSTRTVFIPIHLGDVVIFRIGVSLVVDVHGGIAVLFE